MALTETHGNLTIDGTEKNLFASQTSLKNYATTVFLNSMADGDVIIIRVYVNDAQGTPAERLWLSATYVGAQSDPSIFIPFLPTDSYRVTIQRSAGSITSADWMRLEI